VWIAKKSVIGPLGRKFNRAALYDVGSSIRLENVEYDAFSGRVLADIRRWRSDRWLHLEEEMIERKMAVAWTPEMDDVTWCLLAKDRGD